MATPQPNLHRLRETVRHWPICASCHGGIRPPAADVTLQLLDWGDLPQDLTIIIANELDLDAAKALRLTNTAFRVPGASRFTGANVAAAGIGKRGQFFRNATNICTLRITNKGSFGDEDLARLIEMLPERGAKISRLDLSSCHRITDVGLEQLKSMTAMQSLNLCCCPGISKTQVMQLKARGIEGLR